MRKTSLLLRKHVLNTKLANVESVSGGGDSMIAVIPTPKLGSSHDRDTPVATGHTVGRIGLT
jgi:hypothetical protein